MTAREQYELALRLLRLPLDFDTPYSRFEWIMLSFGIQTAAFEAAWETWSYLAKPEYEWLTGWWKQYLFDKGVQNHLARKAVA